jgi:hypothetical protein
MPKYGKDRKRNARIRKEFIFQDEAYKYVEEIQAIEQEEEVKLNIKIENEYHGYKITHDNPHLT